MPDETLYPDNETEDGKLDAEIMSILEDYADLDHQSGVINGKRAKLRDSADKRGIPSFALQESVRKLKKFTKAERAEHERAVRRVMKAAEGKQTELWPEDAKKNEARVSRKKEKAAKATAAAAEAKAKSIEAGDDNPRSDPASGGAGKAAKKPRKNAAQAAADRAEDAAEAAGKLRAVQEQSHGASPGGRPTEAELTAAAANAALEQQAGGNILDTAIDAMKDTAGKPQSQSEIARQRLEDAKLS